MVLSTFLVNLLHSDSKYSFDFQPLQSKSKSKCDLFEISQR